MEVSKLQDEYNQLIHDLGGTDIELDKPIKFRKTPHSNDIIISVLPLSYNIENYGDAKFTVLQKLRHLKANLNKPVESDYYRMMITNAKAHIRNTSINEEDKFDAFQISEVLAILTGKRKEDIVMEIGNFTGHKLLAHGTYGAFGKHYEQNKNEK